MKGRKGPFYVVTAPPLRKPCPPCEKHGAVENHVKVEKNGGGILHSRTTRLKSSSRVKLTRDSWINVALSLVCTQRSGGDFGADKVGDEQGRNF
jgi:hypothetical protein